MKPYTNKEGKIVGSLKDGVYRSHRQSSKHILQMMDAWGLDEKILRSLKKEGCQEIRILDHDDMAIYRVSLEEFMSKGIERNFVGRQVFLPRNEWVKTVHG